MFIVPGHQVGGPGQVLRLGGCSPVHLAPAPGVDVSIEGSNDGVVHGELDAVECWDLSEEAHQSILIDKQREILALKILERDTQVYFSRTGILHSLPLQQRWISKLQTIGEELVQGDAVVELLVEAEEDKT